jgi:hypothetical protein
MLSKAVRIAKQSNKSGRPTVEFGMCGTEN